VFGDTKIQQFFIEFESDLTHVFIFISHIFFLIYTQSSIIHTFFK